MLLGSISSTDTPLCTDYLIRSTNRTNYVNKKKPTVKQMLANLLKFGLEQQNMDKKKDFTLGTGQKEVTSVYGGCIKLR